MHLALSPGSHITPIRHRGSPARRCLGAKVGVLDWGGKGGPGSSMVPALRVYGRLFKLAPSGTSRKGTAEGWTESERRPDVFDIRCRSNTGAGRSADLVERPERRILAPTWACTCVFVESAMCRVRVSPSSYPERALEFRLVGACVTPIHPRRGQRRVLYPAVPSEGRWPCGQKTGNWMLCRRTDCHEQNRRGKPFSAL